MKNAVGSTNLHRFYEKCILGAHLGFYVPYSVRSFSGANNRLLSKSLSVTPCREFKELCSDGFQRISNKKRARVGGQNQFWMLYISRRKRSGSTMPELDNAEARAVYETTQKPRKRKFSAR